ncbi:MAG: TldD/PmbA family protein [bacterium]
MLTESRCRKLTEKVLHSSKADETECFIQSTEKALTRFANNVIHQNVSESENVLSIRVVVNNKMGRFTTNRLDSESILKALENATNIANLMQHEKDLLPMLQPQTYRKISHYFLETASCDPMTRAKGVQSMITAVRQNGLTAAGIFETGENALAFGNSNGHFCYYTGTEAALSITVTGEDSSGYVFKTSPNISELDLREAVQYVIRNTKQSTNPIEIPSGEYTAILEPQAVANLIPFLLFDYVAGVSSFSGLGVEEKRSFLTDRLGHKVFGDNITIVDDVFHSQQKGPAFDFEGVPKKRVALIENGIAKNLVYDRATAKRHGKVPTGHGLPLPNTYGSYPSNIVMDGGSSTLEKMIQSTKKGILVTRFWYIRLVDSKRIILTGTTRDGTFLIDNGEITHGIKNLRFNQSLIEMLNNVVEMTPPERTSDDDSETVYVVPAMKVDRFRFTSST